MGRSEVSTSVVKCNEVLVTVCLSLL